MFSTYDKAAPLRAEDESKARASEYERKKERSSKSYVVWKLNKTNENFLIFSQFVF